jgi:capsular polysaccharide biosynthesis protein
VELRTYWSIIWRRIWVVVVIVGVVALYVGYQYYHLRKTPGALKAFSSDITIQVGLLSTTKGDPNNANYITVSEALADTLTIGPVLSSQEFDQDVSDQIGRDMSLITGRFGANADLGDWHNTGAIGGALSAVRVHSLVTITTTWATDAGAWAIANAVGEVSVAKLGVFLDYVVTSDASHTSTGATFEQPAVSARVISSATSTATVAGTANSKVALLIALLLVSLAVAIAVTFLLDYLDDRLRSKEQVTHLLQLPVLGDLPRVPTPGRR